MDGEFSAKEMNDCKIFRLRQDTLSVIQKAFAKTAFFSPKNKDKKLQCQEKLAEVFLFVLRYLFFVYSSSHLFKQLSF